MTSAPRPLVFVTRAEFVDRPAVLQRIEGRTASPNEAIAAYIRLDTRSVLCGLRDVSRGALCASIGMVAFMPRRFRGRPRSLIAATFGKTGKIAQLPLARLVGGSRRGT